MEKTNELNKFLSYVHMGTSIYRIYYEHAEKLKNKKLLKLITDILEIFKTHEEKITKLINEEDEEATNSLTAAGIMGVTMEKLKMVDNEFSICTNAIKATYMGMISALKFLNENKKMHTSIKGAIIIVIDDYERIVKMIKDFIIDEYCWKNCT